MIATTHRIGQRIALAAVSRGAEVQGLAVGMPLTQARVLVPGLDVRDADPEGDAALLTRIALFAARRWTPRAAISGEDGLWLDLSGVTHLFGGEERMCRRILAFCARLGLEARIAVAGTWGAAHALARHEGARLTLCPSGGEFEALSPLPVEALRASEDALATAKRLGIGSVGALAAMPRGPLQRRFGAALLARLDQALGRTGEAIDPIVPEEPPRAAIRFAEPIATAEAIETALRTAMARLMADLEAQRLGIRDFHLFCTRVDNAVEAADIGTARATRDGAHLLRLLIPKIETIDPGFGIERIDLVARRVEPLGAVAIEGALAGDKPNPDIVPLVDRLAGRLGARRLFRLGGVESDVPERSIRRVGPLDRPAPWADWPRPVRLLRRPERVDKVMAELPDGPPRRFTWRGRDYRVRRVDGPERIHGEWWRRRAEAEAVRDYFQVEAETGARFWLFRKSDGLAMQPDDWWLQGMFG
ncbi:MAG: DNA polymerase Y family protein [Acetobacteraceae bacterium]|nr:DNA polymerase Y family protein [Acetobacteraceae bacterium]